MSDVTLDAAQRETLAAFADALVPGGEGLPSASGADLHGKWIDRVLRVRDDLAPHVLAVVERGGEPTAELERWRREHPATFEGFALAVSGGYFMNPRVCKLLGLPGNAPKPKPAFPDESDYYLEGGLLDPVLARGPIFRPAPTVVE
jgi:hypothetical protein